MASVHELYTKEVYANLKYRPTWLPGTPMSLGTVGVIDDGIFRATTDLKRLGIPFEESADTARDTIDFTSKEGVSITFKAAGKADARFTAIAKADAGALVEFSRAGAVVLRLKDVSLDRISDQPQLSRNLLRALVLADESKQWQRDWIVITEVARAASATILISNSKDSKLELRASGSTAPTSLVDVSAKLSVAAESQVSTKILAEAGLTPLFRGIRVKRHFFWLYDDVTPAEVTAPSPDEVFGDADPTEDVWL